MKNQAVQYNFQASHLVESNRNHILHRQMEKVNQENQETVSPSHCEDEVIRKLEIVQKDIASTDQNVNAGQMELEQKEEEECKQTPIKQEQTNTKEKLMSSGSDMEGRVDAMQSKSILDLKKSSIGNYDFLVQSGERNEGSYFCNDFVGFPSVPIIGKYGRFGYDTNDIHLLSVHECMCDKETNRITCVYSQEDLDIPLHVKQGIFNIPAVINHNRIVDDPERGPNNNKKQQAQQQNNKQQQKKQANLQQHPFKFPQALFINVSWSVSFQNKSIVPLPPHQNYMNIVLHPQQFKTICLDNIKRMTTQVPVAMWMAGVQKEKQTAENNEKIKSCQNDYDSMQENEDCGVEEWKYDKNNISFKELRSEFLSVHMRGPSLCFSPNNLKFQMDFQKDIVHFFTFVLEEDGFHHLTYHWNVNNFALQDAFTNIFHSSSTLQQVIDGIASIISINHPAFNTLSSMFNSQSDSK